MTKEELVGKLLDYFIHEDKRHLRYQIPTTYQDKRKYLRGLINMREPKEISNEILTLEDNLLQLELKEKKLTDVKDIREKENKIGIFLGDITTLKIDAIVNACNNTLLGCFVPNHVCIDNAIHTYAGIRLRLACQNLMKGTKEKTGQAKITKGYNLPCKYVIHTVGPIIHKQITNKEIEELENCYYSSLELARKNKIRTIAFPCISTGVFNFPKDKASTIAVNTVRKYLEKYEDAFDKIIFNVFTKEDKDYYDLLFKN